MDSRHSNERYCLYHENCDSIEESYVSNHSFDRYSCDSRYQVLPMDPAVILPAQRSSVWGIPGALRQPPLLSPTIPSIPAVPSLLTENGYSYIGVTPMDRHPVLPQTIGPPYTGKAIRAPSQNAPGRSLRKEDRRLHNGPTSRKLVPQEIYKPPRQQKEHGGTQIIKFSVQGEKGIRLSDALEGRWAGFDGRDDRPSFGDDNRLMIILRLQFVGCPPCQSKVSTVDYTARRRPITRTKLASEVAKNVKRLLEREKEVGHSDHSRCNWQDESLGNMYLTRLVRVSVASWQPEIFVVQPFAPTTAAAPIELQ